MKITAQIQKVLLPLSMAGLLAAAFALGACNTAKKNEDEGAATAPAMSEDSLGDSDSGRAMGMETVHFDYDSYVLRGEDKKVLKNNAKILKDNGSVKVQIEGHCDERGGIQYNIALGEKRANAVRKYLTDLGVSGDRVTTISFGKERPIDAGKSDEAYAKNRRGNFVITAR